jgi:uncharacterized Fe-S cluster-containing MiaB family protein
MEKQLYSLLYASSSSKDMSENELTSLLEEIRKKNQSQNITGVLLYGNKSFLQVLEGDKEKLKSLYKKIEKDPRHKAIVKLHEEAIDERIFGEWSMAFSRISPDQSQEIPGFSSFMEDASSTEIMKHNARQIQSFMNTFRWMYK